MLVTFRGVLSQFRRSSPSYLLGSPPPPRDKRTLRKQKGFSALQEQLVHDRLYLKRYELIPESFCRSTVLPCYFGRTKKHSSGYNCVVNNVNIANRMTVYSTKLIVKNVFDLITMSRQFYFHGMESSKTTHHAAFEL